MTIAGLGGAPLLPRGTHAAFPPDLPGVDRRSIDEVIASLGAAGAAESDAIRISAPDVAEDGRTVPVGVASALAGTDRIVILVEKNPVKVVAGFTLPEGTAPAVQTRIRMHETSDILALVRAGGAYYVARREVRVVVGGCGL